MSEEEPTTMESVHNMIEKIGDRLDFLPLKEYGKDKHYIEEQRKFLEEIKETFEWVVEDYE